MRIDRQGRVRERRKKRRFIPVLYFISELVVVGLGLVIWEMSFNIQLWSIGSYIVFGLVFIYGLVKTLHVYGRQREYYN